MDLLLAVPKGLSSTIQSLMSINGAFHAIGGGDLDLLKEKTMDSGVMGCSMSEGERGEVRTLCPADAPTCPTLVALKLTIQCSVITLEWLWTRHKNP